jgi:hypothetical protein
VAVPPVPPGRLWPPVPPLSPAGGGQPLPSRPPPRESEVPPPELWIGAEEWKALEMYTDGEIAGDDVGVCAAYDATGGLVGAPYGAGEGGGVERSPPREGLPMARQWTSSSARERTSASHVVREGP